MKLYTLSAFFCLLVYFLISCSIINNTNYSKLSTNDRVVFCKPNHHGQQIEVSYKDSFKVYEISSQFIFAISQANKKKVWIHFFAPWCNSISRQQLEKLQSIQARFKDDLILIPVSTSYDYQYLADLVINSKLTTPIYVLDGSLYGSNIVKSQEKFFKEISCTANNQHFDDYIIKDDSLVYAHPWKLSLDSFYVKLQNIVKQ